ncbi:PREDICTED: uncharacterized protein LOC104802158 [Tarenaya hassleriana]|uniref:uncharacterized protein LOC104802158 n=1 Tax=Tarenaya hassleriana TaxID=28532 RepID=UPI00053C754B|nr:PREDICTED: uncharacterized protein LOC104802158 [Tarenaya hassleriana]XP_010523930.1 PREDICTED: uncharacterized protein LOC104802158 [Tarenaya hassleriana]
MEESELEEGEACSYNNNGCIDPDTDLSYIDEKLRNVLGHFQKDFEGGVSAENLGAKFGGYGSFLPTYQRSPVLSHPKTPTKPQNCTTPRSPNNIPVECGNAASSIVHKKVRPGNASSSVSSRSTLKALSSTGSANQKKSIKSKKSNHAETSNSRQESANKKPVIFSKQNSLKLRIKVGSDSLPGEKNAAIYSGLGLDVSPSSSFDNSLSESEGMYREPRDSPFESPTSILMVMTSLPVEDHLLSPLSDELIRFVESEKVHTDDKYTPPSRLFTESSHAMVNGSEPKYGEEKPLAEKKLKAVERKSFSAESNGRNKKNFLDGSDAAGKKIETDTSYPIAVDTTKSNIKLFDAVEENSNGIVRSKVVDDGERGLWVPTQHKDLGLDENPRTNSAGSVQEDNKTSSLDVASDYSRKEGKHKGRRISGSAKTDSGASRAKSGHKADLEDSLRKQKAGQRDNTNEQDVAKSLKEQEPQLSSGGKTKLKENRSSSVLDTKKNDQGDCHTPRKEVIASKPQKDARKAEDTYKDFFGDMEESEEEDNGCSLEVKGSQKSVKVVTLVDDVYEKTNFPPTESLPKEVQNAALPILSKPGSDASLANLNPLFIQEHWVACDKCGKWRLLPFGILPKDLPEKWLCTMLNWLPEMNNCNVPEDETTKALQAMYQVPPHNSQAAMQSNPMGISSQFNQGDDFTKRRKKGLKEIPHGMGKEGSRTAETNKKTAQASARNGNINHSEFVNQSDLGRLSDLNEEKQKHKQKEKAKVAEQHSDGGDSRSLKIKSKRDADRESFILAKKMKTESFLFSDHDQGCEYGSMRHGRPSSSGGVPAVSTDNDRRRYFDHSKESETDKKHKPQVSSKRPKEEGSSDMGNSDGTEAKRKRKLKNNDDSQVYKGELREIKNQEQKKARISKYEEKESSLTKGNAKLEKKSKSQLKRELGHVQNSVAATSSSSKISDSHKAKNSIHEGKGSPVESVSSSPMRISDPEKSRSIRRKKEDPHDVNILSAVSLRRFSDGEEDGGSVRSQSLMKDKHGSHESPMVDLWDKEPSLKAKERGEPSLDAKRYDFENDGQNDLPRKLDHSHEEVRQTNDQRHSNGSLPRKSGKGSSSRSKDKNQSIMSDSQGGPRHIEKKKYEGKFLKVGTEGQADVGAHGSPNGRVDSVRPNIPKHYDVAERTSSEKSNKADIVSEREASQSRPPSRSVQDETAVRHPSLLSALKKVDKCGTSAGTSSQADDVPKATAQIRRKNNSATSLQNEHSPSPLRKELTSSQAAHNALKEAKDLKHTADRLKNTVSNLEHIELYFQACLKFLHGAFLLEMSSNESARQGETMVQSMKIYSSTANLCGFCAHEYEKSRDMGAAALAYKCMEVAYMRVVNSSYTSANRYRNELQTSLQMVPPGESPSSSASDVDNVNHPATADKVGTSKGVNSPLVAGNHIITAQNRSNLLRLLQFAQDVSLAMDASRKSRVALTASIGNLGEVQQGEGILSIKRALDYNFQDIEGLLRLVRLAMEANNR